VLVSINPFDGREWARHEVWTGELLEQAVAQSGRAFGDWSAASLETRLRPVRALAVRLESERESLAALATREMGKRLVEALAEVDKCALLCRYVSENAPAIWADDPVATEARQSYVCYDPLGPLLGIMPWNFPFWQALRFALPAIAAGNTVLLKHAPNVTSVSLAIERLFQEAGFPPHVFESLPIEVEAVAGLIADPRVRGVSLTGSTRAGRAVAAQAGAHLKKCVLELGGSDPWIVLADADIEAAARTGVTARFQNAGQSCIAAKRFLVQAEVYDRFLDCFLAGVGALVPGDPRDPQTTLAPMARDDLRSALASQVEDARHRGARLLAGGTIPSRPGYFYTPTVIDGLDPAMRVWREEVFGPAALLFRVRDEEEALELAGATPYGLGASLWTSDLDRAHGLARRLPSGMSFVNSLVKSDPRLPFGGIRDSGVGRELGAAGLREFVNIRTVWIA
jgi:succinate-semialdehyde dehydrogenase/glutarate-semialdehyde dehydrogenase